MSVKNNLFEIAENVSQLNFIFDRVDVLADDLSEQIDGRINLKTEWGIAYAKHELEIAEIKADMLQSGVKDAVEIIKKLLELSQRTYEMVSAESDCKATDNNN